MRGVIFCRGEASLRPPNRDWSDQMTKKIVMPVTLDTKGEEAQFIKNEIEKRGHKTIVIDVGVLGKPQIKADISRGRVARAGGKSLRELVEAARKGADRMPISIGASAYLSRSPAA